MSDENKGGCGDPSCENCGGAAPNTWRDGLDSCIDSTFARGDAMEAKGETPVAVCIFMIGSKGELSIQTAGGGDNSVIDLILAEVAAQVSDILHDRGVREAPPAVQAIMARLSDPNAPPTGKA